MHYCLRTRDFSPEAHVVSPFLGKMNATGFFAKQGSASSTSKLTVFDVLLGESRDSAAVHFEYDWTLKSGDQIVFQGVDCFELGEDGRFVSMSIF